MDGCTCKVRRLVPSLLLPLWTCMHALDWLQGDPAHAGFPGPWPLAGGAQPSRPGLAKAPLVNILGLAGRSVPVTVL